MIFSDISISLTQIRLSQDIYLPTQMVFLRRTIWEIVQEVPNYMSISFACLHFFTIAWWRDPRWNIWNMIVPTIDCLHSHSSTEQFTKWILGSTLDRMSKVQAWGSMSSYLPFRQVQVYRYFITPQSGQIVVMGEFRLKLPDLFFSEGGPLLPGLATRVRFEISILGLWWEAKEKENISTWYIKNRISKWC